MGSPSWYYILRNHTWYFILSTIRTEEKRRVILGKGNLASP